MMKTKFTATAPDGTQFTRRSTHAYTYAILVLIKGVWMLRSYHSRLDLAQDKVVDCARWNAECVATGKYLDDIYSEILIVRVAS